MCCSTKSALLRKLFTKEKPIPVHHMDNYLLHHFTRGLLEHPKSLEQGNHYFREVLITGKMK